MVFFSGKRLFVFQWIDIFFIIYFLFRGLLSFSRGGVLSAMLAFVVFFLLVSRAKEVKEYGLRIRKISLKNLGLFIIGVTIVFFIGDYVTRGALLLRYQGETSGSLSGDKEVTLNTLTTGRFEIMVSDIEMWLDHPIWGVGGGVSASYRVHYGVHEIAAHTEYSRVLAEQGLWGLVLLIVINFYIPWRILVKHNRVESAFLLAFFTIAVLTTFHAGMRTFTTPLLMGMSVIRIKPDQI
nr:O-antigen ligase family protein [Carboxylicivirga linearis]